VILRADARHIPLADSSVQCVVTSPPYWGLRDYGTARWEGGDAGCDHSPARIKGRFDYPTSDKQLSNNGSDDHRYESACPCGARLDSPYRLLWYRVLEDAVMIYLRNNCGSAKASRMTNEARLWLFSDDTGTATMAFVCDALGLQASWLREGLQRARLAGTRVFLRSSPRRSDHGIKIRELRKRKRRRVA